MSMNWKMICSIPNCHKILFSRSKKTIEPVHEIIRIEIMRSGLSLTQKG